MNALLVVPVEETAAMSIPEQWLVLPEEWRLGLSYWHLLGAVINGPSSLPLGPPREIVWTFTSDPRVMRDLELRHDCAKCRAAKIETAERLSSGKVGHIAFVQFQQDYLMTPEMAARV